MLIGFAPFGMDSAEASHTFLRFPWTFGREGYITQGYNGSSHQGGDYFALDIDVEWGSTLGDVRAAVYGEVVGAITGFGCTGSGYGNHVDVRSTTPAAETRYSRYAHLSSVSVSSGQAVFQGQKLGVEGNSGYTYNCGPHLHFRWTTSQNCYSSSCAVRPEPMSGRTGLAGGQTWTSDNTPGTDTLGVYRPSDGSWHLKNSLSGGSSDVNVCCFGITGDVPVTGDWDGDGDDTIGVYRPSDGSWRFKYTLSGGSSDLIVCCFGLAGDVPIVGDWDGDGDDTLGVYRLSDGSWHLKNTLSGGSSDVNVCCFGISGDLPVTGDWDGDGDDTIGVYRPGDGSWRFKYTLSGGSSDLIVCCFGIAGDQPVTGDWDADGDDTLGVYRPSDGSWRFKYTLSGGSSDLIVCCFGLTGDKPVIGDWNGQ